jgi:hypothetical protein
MLWQTVAGAVVALVAEFNIVTHLQGAMYALMAITHLVIAPVMR